MVARIPRSSSCAITTHAITTRAISHDISHLLYFMHRPEWTLTVIICPLKATREIWLIIPSPCIFSLQSTTLSDYIVQILHHFSVTVNNIEVTVNTCTCTDVFTIITTKDQSGGIYNNYSTGGQGFMAVVNKPRPRATPSDSVCLLP